MSHILEDLKQFLDMSPTSWHAAREIGNRLAAIDFTPLEEGESWDLKKGENYFVQRGGSICAFALPKAAPKKINLIGSHTDSPALKLKPNPEVETAGMVLLETELYGSPLLSSWFNRDLAIAGRVIIENAQHEIEEKLVFLDEDPLFIPQLAIHLDREVNEKGLHIDKQDHLRPILTLIPNLVGEHRKTLEELLRQQLFFHSLLSFDLFVVPIEPSRFMGASSEMLASYRLDNLCSAHACTAAIASAKHSDHLQIALFWDHEEIGSKSAEGAASPFLSDVLTRIGASLKLSAEDLIRLKSKSLCISADVAHAFNPNYPSKYDPNNQPLIGRGVVIKYNADKKYASDAKTVAPIIQACQKLGLSHQSYAMRSNMPCGSTIGPIVAQQLGIPTVDIGCPIFSMHAAREVIAGQDHLDLCRLLTHLLEA